MEPTLGTCDITDWRLTPLHTSPTPDVLFQPTEVTYYQNVVIKAIWPAFIGLAAFIAILLPFIIWRLIRLCCCCARCGPSKPNGIKKAPKWYTLLKWLQIVLLVTMVVGSVYGIIKTNNQLVDQGIATLDTVTGLINDLLDTASTGIQTVKEMDLALSELQAIVNADINPAIISSQLLCIRPWVANLPNPGDLSTAVTSFVNGLQSLETSINTSVSYIEQMVKEDSPGVYTGSLVDVLEVKPATEELLVDIQGFTVAATALPVTEDANKMVAVRSALQDLLTTPTITQVADVLDAGAQGLTVVATAVTNAYVSSTAALNLAQSLIDNAKTDVIQVLADVETQYMTARPCIIALIQHVEVVNTTIVVLPADISSAIETVEEAQVSIDDMLGLSNGDATPISERIADAVDSAEAQLDSFSSVVATLNDADNSITANPNFTPATLATEMSTTSTLLQATEPTLQTLLTQIDSYINTGSPSYAVLRATILPVASSASSIASQLQSFLTDADPLFVQAQTGYQSIIDANIPSVVTEITAALDQVPSPAEALEPIQVYTSAYNSLPQPPESLIDDAEAQVLDLTGQITSVITDVKATLGDGIAIGEDTLANVRGNTVDEIDAQQTEYEDDVRYYDSLRRAAFYALFGVAVVLSALVSLCICFNWPVMLVVSTFVLLLLMTLGFILVVVLTAGLKVGNDGCYNLETEILDAFNEDPANADLAVAVQYYLYNSQGVSLQTILRDNFDVDIGAAFQLLEDSRSDVQQRLEQDTGFTLLSKPQLVIDQLIALTYNVELIINDALDLASYESVNPVYLTVKSYGCCTLLDTAGGVWTGLIIIGTAAWIQCVLALRFISFYDKYKPSRCCGCLDAEAMGFCAPTDGGLSLADHTSSSKPQQFIATSNSPMTTPVSIPPAAMREPGWVQVSLSSGNNSPSQL